MKIMNKLSIGLAALFAAVLLITLSACGKQQEKMGDSSMDSMSYEEAAKMYDELTEQENQILTENKELWEKVFMAGTKDMAKIQETKNYGDFLLNTIEAAKDEFSDDEYQMITGEAEKIKEIENKLIVLTEKFPELAKRKTDGGTSVPAENGEVKKFPTFEGKDLDGNQVKSDELFGNSKVTVMNFWFTTCNPCVRELPDLESLNDELKSKGGQVVGVNSFTLDGDQQAISEAKDVLNKKGVTYKNVYFDSNSEAGKFTNKINGFPTTIVVDRNGNIVGDPIVGPITEQKQKDALMKLVDQAIANDKM